MVLFYKERICSQRVFLSRVDTFSNEFCLQERKLKVNKVSPLAETAETLPDVISPLRAKTIPLQSMQVRIDSCGHVTKAHKKESMR